LIRHHFGLPTLEATFSGIEQIRHLHLGAIPAGCRLL
jgi:hypothetical protein